MINCNACGQQNEEGVRTCVFCGTPMDPETQSQYSNAPINFAEESKKVSDKPSVGLLVLSVLFAPISGVVLYILKKNDNKNIAKKYLIATLATFAVALILSGVLAGGMLALFKRGPVDTTPTDATVEVTENENFDNDDIIIGGFITANKNITLDDINITVAENQFTEIDKVYMPGKKYQVLKITVKYTSNNVEDWWTGDVKCIADDNECQLNAFSNDTDTKPLSSAPIKPGETLTGVYYYNVPSGAKNIKLEFNSIFDATPTTIVLTAQQKTAE